MDRDLSAFHALFQAYSTALSGDVSRYALKQSRLGLPRPDPPLLTRLFRHVQSLFEAEPTLLKLASPCIIVGDIHGQILDLFRILNCYGPSCRYLFLGDIVDRGEFSVECLICVFLLKALFPDSVFLIRGNHEFVDLCCSCGFMSQMIDFFDSSGLYQESLQVFAQIPLAACIDDSILCVHGGLGPDVTDLECITFLTRPIENFGDRVVDSLVWSDPDPQAVQFLPSFTRGAGYLFGEAAAVSFLDRAGLSVLVRAHECVPEGAKELWGGRVITVFSASNYCGLMGNEGAVLEVSAPGKRNVRVFPPMQWLLRSSVQFQSSEKMTRESSMLVRRMPLSAKVAQRGGSGDLPMIEPMRGIGRKALLESESLGTLPKLGAEAPPSPPSPLVDVGGRFPREIIATPGLGPRTLRPAMRGKGGRRFSTTY
jgi:protein phosphatase